MSIFNWGGRRDTAPTPIVPAENLDVTFVGKTSNQLDLLRTTVFAASGSISPEVFSLLRQVDDILRPLLKFIETHPVYVETEVLITAIITDYIPTPLTTFMSLSTEEQRDGGTADLSLQRQYATIRDNAHELSTQVITRGLTELTVQENFIKTRFEQGV